MRVCLVADMLEERWPSMDLFAEMLAYRLPQAEPTIKVEMFRLGIKHRIGTIAGASVDMTADRLIGRHFDYPRALRRRVECADIYHILDHTYAACVHSLRRSHTVVTCHDLDAFDVLMNPSDTIAEIALARLARITLKGLQRASHVVCDSNAIKKVLAQRGWVPEAATMVIPAGVHPSCTNFPSDYEDRVAESLVNNHQGPLILHVSSTISRKRIDILLQSFAVVKAERPDARLVRAGGNFTESQRRMVAQLGLGASITVLPFLDRPTLAAIYRRASLVVLPSEKEGFGLPIIEAMACGTPVLASDIEVLREVGGSAASYVPPGKAYDWAAAILGLLDERDNHAERWSWRIQSGLTHARQYSWADHARRLAQLYHTLINQ